jgi:hypothetical protein
LWRFFAPLGHKSFQRKGLSVELIAGAASALKVTELSRP